MATMGLSLVSMLFIAILMIVVVRRSFCLERFGWMVLDPCNSIPFPFGTSGNALPGFEVTCSSEDAYLVPSNGQSYTLLAIDTYTVTVSVGSIYSRCYIKENESEIIEDNSSLLNLDGTPYIISTDDNVLVHVGCDDILKINTKIDTYNEQNGCVTFCGASVDNENLYCSGLGCCYAALPGIGMKSFNLKFEHIFSGKNDEFSNCSISFIAQQIEASSIASHFLYKKNYNSYLGTKEKKYYPYIQTLTLKWYVGNQTCEEARNKSESYLCKDNSECYNSGYRSYSGYFCNCSKGFQGNPYVEGGCTDINECKDPALNPCNGICINEIGSVSCGCPKGMVGNGYKQGSECKKAFPLALTLGLGLGSLFILSTTSFLAYMSFQRNKLIKRRAVFFRQNGGYVLKQRYGAEGVDPKTKIFTEEQLQKATNNYNESRILGRGGFGTVYRGILQDKNLVAIKKSKLSEQSQVEQFVNEITILSQINHRNVVKLLGCCLETEVPLLVYEFIPNGTLFNLIHCSIPLPWKDRLQIAADIAGVVAYLHSAASPPIIHRDIKSANILLDENYTAKISDFGASRSVPFDQTHVTTVVQGTFGYLDPEYFTTHQLTEKSDVYSFGVVLAELWLREKPISLDRPVEVQGLAAYFSKIVSEYQLVQVIEPYIVEEAGIEQIEAVGMLTNRCLSLKGEERPTMREVAIELERLLRHAINQESAAQMATEELQPLLNEPMVAGIMSSSLNNTQEEMTRQYSLEGSMLSSMELPR